MDAKELFLKAIKHSTAAIKLVKPGDFTKPTPDTDWNVHLLVEHMLYELNWTADILRGLNIAEIGTKYEGDLIGQDLWDSWREAADEAKAAVKQFSPQQTAHLSYADVTNEDYLREAGTDQLIHAWDLSVAMGKPIKFDPELTLAIYDRALQEKDNLAASGLFAPPVDVPERSSLQTKLLALYGRSVDWQPTDA